jgi:hypothetical protein
MLQFGERLDDRLYRQAKIVGDIRTCHWDLDCGRR